MKRKITLLLVIVGIMTANEKCLKSETKPKFKETKIINTLAPYKSIDLDNDTVLDDNDKCLNSIKNAVVDSRGCQTKDKYLILFNTDDYSVKKQNEKKLKKISTLLRVMPHYSLELIGRADRRGDKKYNYALSQDRVEQVFYILTSKYQIDKKRIKKTYLGEQKPLKLAKIKNKKKTLRINRSVLVKIKNDRKITDCRN